jgi:drug/metabolite transporter (DMT)-like permease
MQEKEGDMTKNLRFEIMLLCVLATLWGGSYPLIKLSLESFPPLSLMTYRVALATVFLLIVMKISGQHLPKEKRLWGLLLIQSIFNSVAPWSLLAWGQQYVDSGLAAVLNSTSPIFVFFITLAITRHEKTGVLRLCGALLGVSGVVLIMGTEALSTVGDNILAQSAILLSAFFYGWAAIFGKRFTEITPMATATGTLLCATVFMIPLSLSFETPWDYDYSNSSLLAATLLSIACTGGALLLYFRLVRTLGSMGTASQAYLRIGIALMVGVMFLDEVITPTMAFGVVAAVIGVAAINLPSLGQLFKKGSAIPPSDRAS